MSIDNFYNIYTQKDQIPLFSTFNFINGSNNNNNNNNTYTEISSVIVGISTAMTLVFLFFAVYLLYSIIRDCMVKASQKTKMESHIFMIFCCLGRIAYFILKIISVQHPLSVLGPSLLFYHFGSAFFYSSFIILVLFWGEVKLAAGSMAIEEARSRSSKIRWGIYIFIATILIIQLGLSITRMVISQIWSFDVDPPVHPEEEADYLESSQLFYHSTLCVVIVLLFISYSLYIRRSEWPAFGQFTRVNYVTKAKPLFIVMVVVGSLILLKGVANFGLAILDMANPRISKNPLFEVILFSISAMLLDVLPTVLMSFVLVKKDRDSDSLYLGNKQDHQLISDDTGLTTETYALSYNNVEE